MKKVSILTSALCLTLALAAFPASALEYSISAPGDPEYGKPTSFEPVATADNGAMPNNDLSKNAALIPPMFGSPTSYLPGSGEYLTPNMVGKGITASMGTINGNTADVVTPGSTIAPPSNSVTATAPSYSGYTEVTSELVNSDGSLGVLSIPTLGVKVKVFEGTSDASLAKGVGHFSDTSIWDGNVGIAGHNRGTNSYFGEIHNLNVGDKITLSTNLGTRTFSVTSVSKISDSDNSLLGQSTDNRLTLITCVRNQSAYRWCVQAVEI